MNVETKSISEIKPYERNARKCPQKAVDKVAASLKEFGWNQPIVVDKRGVIIVGHTRYKAALQLGYAEVPVIVASHLSAAKVKAYRLADNRTHDETTWDDELLGLEFADLKLDDIDLQLTGFDLPQIENFLAVGRDDDAANEAPALPEVAVTRPGDLWVLGKHRLLCGDSTNAENVARLLGDAKLFLMVTDPPYGVEYDPKWRDQLDDLSLARGSVANDDRADWSAAWNLFPGDVAYTWSPAGSNVIETGAALQECGFIVRSMIIWRKPHFAIGRGAYHWQHEPCWYAVRKGASAHWRGDRKQSTVWDIANALFQGKGQQDEADKHKTGHGTQKPIECMRRPILNHTVRGESVYDPFLGSGTTLIACEQTERVCYGLELDPKYCDVIVQRWQKFTGKTAGLAECGRTFEQVAADRQEQAHAA